MTNFDNGLNLSEGKNVFLSVILILFFSLIGATIIGISIGLFAGFLFFDGNMSDYLDIMSGGIGDNRFKIPLYVMQGVSSILGFIVIPALFMIMYEKRDINDFFTKKMTFISATLAVMIAVVFTGFNSWFVEWNMNIDFPEALAGFETFAKNMESQAMETTKFLTDFGSPGIFLLAFIVIAIVPGIGEELVFRGFLQNYFHKAFNNIHIAIWISAAIFSAIHLQFYGFIPRMLLGALFGYLYHWSGNLLIPMLAHAANNALMLIMMYMYQLNYFETNPMDVENTEAVPLSLFLISGIVSFALLFYFRKINSSLSVANE